MEYLNRLYDLYNRYFEASLMDIGISIVIFISAIILSKFITIIMFKIGYKITEKSKTKIDDEILEAFRKPLRGLLIVLGLYLALINLPFSQKTDLTIIRFFRASLIIMITWGLYNVEGTYDAIYDKIGNKLNLRTQKILKPFISKALRITTILISIAIIAEEFGYSVSAFVAGLGIGGIAIAMAAKDTLANIFGGVAILMDKPFDISDWIYAGDIEGTVENINFRSTKIRTFDKGLVSYPNSKLSEHPIINYSRRGLRRIEFHLGVTYDTPSKKVKKVAQDIKKMLSQHNEVDNDLIISRFEAFNDSSLDIYIYYFAKAQTLEEFLRIKEDVNIKIMEILEKEKVEVAFPSTSIYFENQLKSKKSNETSESNEN